MHRALVDAYDICRRELGRGAARRLWTQAREEAEKLGCGGGPGRDPEAVLWGRVWTLLHHGRPHRFGVLARTPEPPPVSLAFVYGRACEPRTIAAWCWGEQDWEHRFLSRSRAFLAAAFGLTELRRPCRYWCVRSDSLALAGALELTGAAGVSQSPPALRREVILDGSWLRHELAGESAEPALTCLHEEIHVAIDARLWGQRRAPIPAPLIDGLGEILPSLGEMLAWANEAGDAIGELGTLRRHASVAPWGEEALDLLELLRVPVAQATGTVLGLLAVGDDEKKLVDHLGRMAGVSWSAEEWRRRLPRADNHLIA